MKNNQSNQNEKYRSEADKCFKSLERKVKKLVEFILEKKNLHAELKTMARTADCMIEEYAKLRVLSYQGAKRSTEKLTVRDDETQTSPIFREKAKKREHLETQSPTIPPAMKKAKSDQEKTLLTRESEERKEIAEKKASEWKEVRRKGKAKKKEKKRKETNKKEGSKEGKTTKTTSRKPRPEAIKIKALGETSYADILRKVKAAPNMKEIGERVTRIRRTRAGELPLELGKPGTGSPNIEEMVLATPEESAEVHL
ncbi:uncharacterized protein LOC131670424 [Phymastichus coffea]|uniref:uncharacterized protein LOC131670424 n=1 Tax=Phymastichus coffea TaxID=108790 RepID=UPI00273C49CB|nr:uncharacterized protein LOC131670424 [Phymastichus coffea]